MKISKEQFNKLSQLDRIEYRQRRDIIEEDNQGFLDTNLLWNIIIFAFMITLLGFVGIQENNDGESKLDEEQFNTLIKVSVTIMTFTLYLAIFMFISLIIVNYVKRIEINKLNEEYFKIELKRGKK